MRFLIGGASGFLGTAWCRQLSNDGHEVVRLVRRPAAGEHESTWDPYRRVVDRDEIERADVVVNLAGAPLAHWPWTAAYRKVFLDSRVATTRTLAEAVAGSERHPLLVAQNGIAGYGDRGDAVSTEETPTTAVTMLAEVTRAWEAATEPASEAGARVVVLRTSVVLDRHGGALKAMLPAFRLGVGGRIGSGEQFFSTISLPDWLGAATALALDPASEGAYNITGPGATTNSEFTRALGELLHRPTVLRVPAWPLRTLVGEVSDELLGSARVEPARLLAMGFAFQHPTLTDRLRAALA